MTRPGQYQLERPRISYKDLPHIWIKSGGVLYPLENMPDNQFKQIMLHTTHSSEVDQLLVSQTRFSKIDRWFIASYTPCLELVDIRKG
jgi:hypothetical protein